MSSPFSLKSLNKVVPPVPLWLYRCIAIFPITGIMGLDHFLLGSHFTGILKLFINSITLGSWYAYDIVQVLYPSNIKEHGLQVPFLEMGSIGKGRVDETPISVMSKHTKLWIMISFIALFGSLYFITSFFVTSATDVGSTALRWISILAFFVTIIMFVATVVYYLGGKIMSLIRPKQSVLGSSAPAASILPGASILGATPSVSTPSLAGFSLPGIPSVASVPGVPSVSGNPTIPGFHFGGGGSGATEKSMNELSNIAKEVIEGGSMLQIQTYDHITFPIIMALLPLSGFIIYILRKNTNKNETS